MIKQAHIFLKSFPFTQLKSLNFVRVEKDKIQIQAEIGDVRCATEEVHRSQASAEKQNKNLLLSLNDVNKRIEEHNCNMVNLEAVRRRLTTENADLLSQLQVRRDVLHVL